jgi:hypothetical protein
VRADTVVRKPDILHSTGVLPPELTTAAVADESSVALKQIPRNVAAGIDTMA